MYFKRIVTIYTLFVLTATSCEQKLTLIKSNLKSVNGIDTIEAFPEHKIYILLFIRHNAFDYFSSHLAFEKQDEKKESEKLYYEFDSEADFRISKDYISLVDTKPSNKLNWGWFQMINGKVSNSLPYSNRIYDSLQEANEGYFIQENNGYFIFFNKGKVVKELNYGNLVTKERNLNFDSLAYKLYRVRGDSLIIASEIGNDLFKQKDGVYFIPKPGYGVTAMYSKRRILDVLDSISLLPVQPSQLQIEQAYSSNQ